MNGIKFFYVEVAIAKRTSDPRPRQLRNTLRMSLLEIAIHHASLRPPVRPSQMRILKMLLEEYSHADDAEMIFALQHSSAEVVQALLAHWPDGKLTLKPNILRPDKLFQREISRGGLLRVIHEGLDIGPLWYIARRDSFFSGEDTAAAFFELFMRRGENINGQCGPVGTALHSALLCFCSFSSRLRSSMPHPRWIFDHGMWNILIAKGADVNASGPFGTPLEFLWRLANTVEEPEYRNVKLWTSGIRWLITKGAKNSRPDPNGSVPS